MKSILTFTLTIILATAYTQDTTVIISRNQNQQIPLQAVLELESVKTLFVGQEYTFNLTSSGYYDIRITTANASVKLIEESKKSTGGFRYSFTPKETGKCAIIISNQIDEKKVVDLKMQTFQVINYPIPPIHIQKISSGNSIMKLDNASEITCEYSKETGIFEKYEIISWEAIISEKTFGGNGTMLSKELIQHVNEVDHKYMRLTVFLKANKTGHLSSEGIYYIKKSN